MKPLITLLLETMIWGWSRQPNQLNKLQSTHTYTHTIRWSKIHDPIIINLINGSTKKKSNLNCPRLLIFLFLWYHCFKCCCYWERNTTFSNLFPLILKLWETYLKQNQKNKTRMIKSWSHMVAFTTTMDHFIWCIKCYWWWGLLETPPNIWILRIYGLIEKTKK